MQKLNAIRCPCCGMVHSLKTMRDTRSTLTVYKYKRAKEVHLVTDMACKTHKEVEYYDICGDDRDIPLAVRQCEKCGFVAFFNANIVKNNKHL
jgi:uncharacterized Zn finger protein